ncbi:MAG: dinitrogenase iron-molybdenum cofactor biosynthesis protein [Planctomycetes bacterium]|jgi:predicted Fe-Mo cluster-binding NifX family protein|nr:dinitrogenase iron-molybdenum cofactor biosynthesis protein [Planctomycetota bacterium]
MKVAVTSQGEGLEATVDPRFGRARCFVVVDTETGEHHTVDNAQNVQAAQGAGIQAGRTVGGLGVAAILSGHVGPKAFATLRAAGVEVCTGATGTVGEAVETFKAGNLPPVTDADVEGHWV